MTLLQRLNTALAKSTGFEVRRAARPRSSASASAAKTTPAAAAAGKAKTAPKPKPPKPQAVEYRPPTDPGLDRLLRRPVFIIAPVRSGSTLLRMLLNSHSQLHAPHELHFRRLEVRASTALAERSMSALDLDRGDLEHLMWDRLLHRELVRSGKEFIVEKTPSNAFVYKRIAACWPDARFIFLQRHPVSVASSWHEADPKKRNAEEAALDALRYMNAAERARKGLTGHVVRYEDLTDDPAGALKDICSFLEIEFEPEMLEYGARNDDKLQKGLGDWKDKIRSGTIQPGRKLPSRPEDIPEVLRGISAAWGYTAGLVGDRRTS
ncbi:sulfotransferase family protein [Streptomyces sp. 6N223]|uniref:sulfotransferase family protein n=1 Tax=Streptomyces sp. 6N223 TaxID=3457412 RepID=UPI003FD6434F